MQIPPIGFLPVNKLQQAVNAAGLHGTNTSRFLPGMKQWNI
jgi:hypothetical protein